MAPWARAWLSAVALPAPLSGPPGSVRVHSSAGEVAGSGRDMLALAVVMALLPVAAMVVVAVEVVVLTVSVGLAVGMAAVAVGPVKCPGVVAVDLKSAAVVASLGISSAQLQKPRLAWVRCCCDSRHQIAGESAIGPSACKGWLVPAS